MISDDLGVISDIFVKLSLKKKTLKKIESILGARVVRSSSSSVCIPQKSLSLMFSGIQTHMGEPRAPMNYSLSPSHE